MPSQSFSGQTNPSLMKVMPDATASAPMVSVACCDRWQAYFRLKELEIPCQCSGYQSLLVDVSTAQAGIQLWSVVRRLSTSRLELAEWLDHCLDLPC